MIYLVVLTMILLGVYMYDLQRYSEGKYNLFLLILTLLIIISGLAYRLGGDGLHYLLEYNTYSIQDGFGWEALNKYKDRPGGGHLCLPGRSDAGAKAGRSGDGIGCCRK